MGNKYNKWSFYLFLVSLLFTLSIIFSPWNVAPPIYILWLITVIAFILGILGLKDKTSGLKRIRSWVTISFSMILALILFLGVLRPFFIAEDLIKTTKSPNHTYKIEFYLINGGATTPYSVAGRMDGPLWFEKTIYYDYRLDQVDVKWINNHTISINNHILDLKKGETYSDSE